MIFTLMGSFTPLDVEKLKNQNDVPQPITDSAVSVPHDTKPSFSKPLFMMLSLVIVFVSGIFFAQQIFRTDSARTAQGQEPPTPIPVTTAPSKILVGIDATFPPMEYTNENNELVGFDVDLMKNVAEELGTTVEFKTVSWDDIFNELEAGQLDMIASSVSITDERKERFIFSEPYLNAGQVLITRSTEEMIGKTEDLSGKKVGVQRGTTNEEEAAKYTTDDLIIRYDDFQEAANDLVSGEVDVILSDLPGAKGIVTEHPELKIASDPFTNDFYGIPFKKDNIQLRDSVNRALDSLRQKGILNSLKEKWLN